MIALPERRYAGACDVEYRKVAGDSTVSIRSVRYTVPVRLAHRQVRVRLYAERFEPNHVVDKTKWWVAVRGERFKMIHNVLKGRSRLFDLVDDPHEQRNLMNEDELGDEARAAHLRLVAALKEITKT